jgi:YwqJ-like deaminase
VIETVIDFIATMARKLKNGAVKLFEDFKQFIDDVFKWLEEVLKGDKVLEKIIYKLSNEAELLLLKYADNALLAYTKLDRPAVVSVLEGRGKQVFAYSNKSGLDAGELPKGLHPLVKKWLNEANESIRLRPQHGKCAEPSVISKWLWEIDPKGKMKIDIARKEFEGVVGKATSIKSSGIKATQHGKLKEACPTCNPLLKYFNIIEIH